jgi:uncharacterized protein
MLITLMTTATWAGSFSAIVSGAGPDLTLVILLATAIAAGFIDAIAGGGGLILVPAFLLSGLPVSVAIGTNKLCNVAASFSSAVGFSRKGKVDWRYFSALVVPATLGAFVGSRFIGLIPPQAAEVLVVAVLVAIVAVVLFRPALGADAEAEEGQRPLVNGKGLIKLMGFGLLIGFHDGFFGPGAGIFFIFALVAIPGLNFIKASGTAKTINMVTSLVALVSFILAGSVNYRVGVVTAVGVIGGSYLGASFASKKGTRLVKPAFLAMAVLITAKILLN